MLRRYEFALEYEGENSAKYANRNQKKGSKNEAFLQTPHFFVGL